MKIQVILYRWNCQFVTRFFAVSTMIGILGFNNLKGQLFEFG